MFLENSHLCPERFHADLAASLNMGCISGIENTHRRGVPVRRPRRFTFCWNLTKFRCDGSFVEYDRMFDRSCQMSGKDLWGSTTFERQTYMRDLAKTHGDHFHPDVKITLTDVLTGAEQERLREHRVSRSLHVPTHDPRANVCGLDGSYFTNVDQHTEYVSSGCFIPCLTKHSKVVSLPIDEAPELATPRESLVFMSENCCGGLQPFYHQIRYPCLFQDWLDSDQISAHKQKEMAGNAMHMISIGQFMLYCLSSLEVIETE